MILLAMTFYVFIFADSTNKGSNIANGSVAKSKVYSHEKIQENNLRSHKFIQTYEEFKNKGSSVVAAAANATVQIIPKCQIAIDGDRFYIGQEKTLGFCEGHPLANYGIPTPLKNKDDEPMTLAKNASESRKPCSSRPCSGALIGSQQTIGTAGHCMQGLSAKDFCNQFVFVLGRTGTKTSFSKDEVLGCEDGAGLDTGATSADFNFHADGLSQDHAVLRLKKPVPETVAKALQVRSSVPKTKEKLFVIGHPYGQPRMVSPLTTSFVKNGDGYNYIHGEAYVYGGNSGGPLIDSEGKVAGIMVATDDKEYGSPQKREPIVEDSKTGKMCRTQIADSTIEVEAVGFGSKIQNLLETQISQTTYSSEKQRPIDLYR